MSDWTSGYVADIGYAYGYYKDLNPLRRRLAFLNAGLAAPDIGNACELGFGQGMSVNIHAAALNWPIKLRHLRKSTCFSGSYGQR